LGFLTILVALTLLSLSPAPAADLLPGEFDKIDLGRRMIEPKQFPTVRELRAAVAKPEIRCVLMFKLCSTGDNHHLPVWSSDGQRLAVQRSDLGAKSSRLLLYRSLGQAEPTLLTDEGDAYDYQLRWAVGDAASYSFVRIRSGAAKSRVFVATGDGQPQAKTPDDARREFPALYRRTDGIWRLIVRQDGELMHQAWNDAGPVDQPFSLGRGTAPRWSRDGSRLLYARERASTSRTPVFDVVVRNLRSESETVLPCEADAVVRSPVWSPDERHAAFYVREIGEGKPWRIHVATTAENPEGRTLGGDVVVNPNFESEGPAWEPGGGRVWFFSHEHRQQAYYPLVAADVARGEVTVVDYPARCTTPNDLAVHPVTYVPEIAIVGHDGLPQDLFLLFLNHY
jgi:hypothetical protein